jgi:thiol-disulfide isomerase/thioredoxin
MKKLLIFALLFIFVSSVAGQARRVKTQPTTTPTVTVTETAALLNAQAMYDEANEYAKKKFEELARKQVSVEEDMRLQIYREQKLLAAKYASQLEAQTMQKPDDIYFTGLLHVLAENAEGANAAMRKYLSLPETTKDKVQTARSVLVVTAARSKDFAQAEALLNEYLKNDPVKLRERAAMERELADAYLEVKNLPKAAAHAEEAYRAIKPSLQNASANSYLISEALETGFILFEIYSANKQSDKAIATLEEMRELGAFISSTKFYFESTDKLVTYLVDLKRKNEAVKLVADSLKTLSTKFRDRQTKESIEFQLKKRQKQYLLMGEIAPEIAVDKWISPSPMTLANLRGKVVLIDFWATWCKPCFVAFPFLTEWHQNFSKEGLVIIGLTRYYGQAGGFNVDENAEFAFLQNFKQSQRLPYSLAVAKDDYNVRKYFVSGIPTTVLIDRQGVIRYVRSGAGGTEEEIEKNIRKLLAEK